MQKVRIVSKEEFRANLLTNKNLYVANWKNGKIYDPWMHTLGNILAMVENNKDTFCFEVIEEEENESETD